VHREIKKNLITTNVGLRAGPAEWMGGGTDTAAGNYLAAVEGEDLKCQRKFSGSADTGSPAINCGKNRRNPATSLIQICLFR
jgi:hypothetical protein